MIQNLADTESGDDQSADELDDVDSRISLNEENAASSSESSADDSSKSDTDEYEVTGAPTTTSRTETAKGGDEKAVSRDGTEWRIVATTAPVGRVQAQNVFTAKPGPTNYTRTVTTALDAFRLLVDEGMIRHIKRCTVEYAHTCDVSWDVTDDERDAFIGLLYLRGCMNARNFPLDLLWSEKYGSQAFRQAMPRDRFKKIKEYIRFDLRSTREERIKKDKFCLMSWVLERFVENSQKAYIPYDSLTVDEQLFPTKARCRFTQYMPNKPDKFGIKFWILAEVQSKYCLSVKPYLGKDEQRVDSLGTHVVMSLVEPYFGRGYNVTTDNFFTSRDLALKLMEKRTSLVGTLRSNRKEIPKSQAMATHESIFYTSGSMNLVKYQAKPSKTVVMLSTLHRGATCQMDGKKKPESILYYNENKCGVDMLDAMCRQMSTKAGCRRWPLAVFYNILDLAGVNSWVIFRKATGSNISRREFLRQLSSELTSATTAANTPAAVTASAATGLLEKRVNCQIKVACSRNRTVTVCDICKRPACGKCLAKICMACKDTAK